MSHATHPTHGIQVEITSNLHKPVAHSAILSTRGVHNVEVFDDMSELHVSEILTVGRGGPRHSRAVLEAAWRRIEIADSRGQLLVISIVHRTS